MRRFALSRRRQLLLTAISAVSLTSLWSVGLLRPFEDALGDLLLRLPPPGGDGRERVVAVLITDDDVATSSPLPWPRHLLAELVDRVFDGGAAAVALDMILPEAGERTDDDALAAALQRGPAVVGAALGSTGGWLLPPPGLRRGVTIGHVEAEIGSDGVVRAILATKQRDDRSFPAFALVAARLLDPSLVIEPGAVLRPDFRPPPQRIPQVAAGALLDGATPDLAGQLVFIGVSATAGGDQFVVPTRFHRPSPGVLVHASAAASILRRDLLRPVHLLPLFAASLALAGLAQLLRNRSGRLQPLVLGAVLFALLVASLPALWLLHIQLPLLTLSGALGLSALLRETTESAVAHRQTGALLHGLVEVLGDGSRTAPPPRAAGDRLALALDLQERVLHDLSLRRTLLDSLEDGVVRWDEDGEPVVANAAALRLWGAAPRLAELRSSPEAGARTGTGTDDRVIEHQGRHLRLVTRALADGTLGLLRDVTAERELESHRREMQRLVSHELKTPLASIAGFAGMLQRYTLTHEELQRLAALVGSESQRLLEMVTGFLDLERLASGRLDAQRERVDLVELAEERREVLSAAAGRPPDDRGSTRTERRRLVLRTAGTPVVAGDRQLLARMIDNLVGNALKYAPPASRIDLEVAANGERVRLEVRDEGPGIPATALPHLFERFYRVPGNKASGSGLGLALVREIADWHGGCVKVKSELGSGSTFTVELPALDASGSDEEGDDDDAA